MNTSLRKLALAALLAVGSLTNASAVTVLGYLVANSASVNPGGTNEMDYANHLLDMALNSSDPAGIPPPPSAGTLYYLRNGNVDPGSGEIVNMVQGSTGDNSVPAGYEYAFGRYDGPNGGYILWHLGGAAFEAPASSDGGGNWGTTANGLSHFTAFNARTTVPDGGATVALLGAALGVIALIRRRLS